MKSKITPVTVFPGTADTLTVDSFNGLPPSYRWGLASSSTAGDPPVTTLTELRAGNDSFTQAQWDAWTTQSDDTYPLQVAAANLGVTIIQ